MSITGIHNMVMLRRRIDYVSILLINIIFVYILLPYLLNIHGLVNQHFNNRMLEAELSRLGICKLCSKHQIVVTCTSQLFQNFLGHGSVC